MIDNYSMRSRWLLAALPLCATAQNTGIELFESSIRPALVQHCQSCHSGDRPQGNLRLDHRDGWKPVGAAAILRAIRHEPGAKPMPLGAKKLPAGVITSFEEWVRAGAPDPRERPAAAAAAVNKPWEEVYQERKKWWSLQPLAASNPGKSIDAFLLDRLHRAGLKPAPPAQREILLRRLSFVLTGLPPTPEETAAFLADPSPNAYERQVDRLLESPHFGERWARHWMDVVRYSDTYGYEWDIPAKGAWRYRDYLIRALNQDVGFDQLAREHIAGDLLPNPRIDASSQINESITGTMFYQMGEKRHGDSLEFNGIHQEMLHNKVDAFSKAFQATTVGCARCHDHKLDAVSQRDYYALAGLFMSARWITNTLDLPERNRGLLEQLRGLKPAIRASLQPVWREDSARIAAKLIQLKADKTTPEHPLHVWNQMLGAADMRAKWTGLREAYAKTATPAPGYTVLADFTKPAPAGWSVDGVGLRNGPSAPGDFAVALDGDHAVSMLLPAGLYTNSLSPRMNGAVRTPHLNHTGHRYISFELAGGDFAAYRTVVDNAFLTERQVYLKSADPYWVRLDAGAKASTHRAQTEIEKAETRVYFEIATKTSNPNFPPRVGLGGRFTDEQAADPRSWFGVLRVVGHDGDKSPTPDLTPFLPLLDGEAPETAAQLAQRYQQWLSSAVEAWIANRATATDIRLINWMLAEGLLTNRADSNVARYRQIEKQLAEPATVNGMSDVGPGYDYRLNKRGVYEDLGDKVPRAFPTRLQLAGHIASPANPITARVFVNRVWHWVFGAGLVPSTDDFGHLGDLPSHPELLDHLAASFTNNRWSAKQLIRRMVTTAAFRQSGEQAPRAREVDPLNRLLHHYPVRRLEAEALRDSILAVSGRLDPQLYGPPLNPARANEDPEKRLFSGPVDGAGRRSIYIKMTIMEPPKFLAVFNQPSPKIPAGRRDVTNVAAQALALLNDPFVEGQAGHWARALIADSSATPSLRVAAMFQRALGRKPAAHELDLWSTAAQDLATLHRESGDMMKSLPVWQDLAHAMFNSKEFLYVR